MVLTKLDWQIISDLISATLPRLDFRNPLDASLGNSLLEMVNRLGAAVIHQSA